MNNEFVKLNWFGISPRRQKQEGRVKSGKGSRFINLFLPLSADYFNPLNSIFASQVKNLRDLGKSKVWFFRDGLLPLIYFFKKFPDPGNLQSQIYVSHRAASFVPNKWKSQVHFYEEVSAQGQEIKLEPGLIGMPTVGTPHDRNKILKTYKSFGNKKQFRVCFWHHWGNLETRWPVLFSLKDFENKGKTTILQQDPVQFFLLKNLKGSLFIDLSLDYFISDRTTTHYSLSRQAKLWGVREVKKQEIDLLLSPYHGFCFSKKGSPMGNSEIKEIQKLFKQHLNLLEYLMK